MSSSPALRDYYDRLWSGGGDAEVRRRWSFQEPLVARALARLGEVEGKRVLEIGPGTGAETATLVENRARVVAVDLSTAALSHTGAAAGGRASLLCAAAEALPLAAESIDLIFTQTVLMHLDLARAAAEWARVLRPGGRVVALEPIAGNPLVGAYRRWLSPYRDTEPRYVTVADLRAADPRLELVVHEEHYLLSVAALGLPGPLARLAARPFAALDAGILRLAPGLGRYAWMTLAELRRC